jgi:hypothetical protein
MNYIHKLQKDNEGLKDEINIIKESLDDLRRYLNSSKFQCGDELDGYVNVKDVLDRLPIIFKLDEYYKETEKMSQGLFNPESTGKGE